MRQFLGILTLIAAVLPRPLAGAESLAYPAKASIAILPMRNEADPYFTLSEDPKSDLDRVMDFVSEHRGKTPKNRDLGNAESVRTSLVFHVGRGLAQRGYRVYMGRQYEDFYRDIEARGQEITYRELQHYVPADAFLLIVIDGWNPKDFDSLGRLDISYCATLIDPKRADKKGVVWTFQAKKTIELEPNDFAYRKRYEEMIQEISRVMLSRFPKTAS